MGNHAAARRAAGTACGWISIQQSAGFTAKDAKGAKGKHYLVAISIRLHAHKSVVILRLDWFLQTIYIKYLLLCALRVLGGARFTEC